MVFFLHGKEKKKEEGKTKRKTALKPLDDEKREGEVVRSKKPVPLVIIPQLLVQGLVSFERSDHEEKMVFSLLEEGSDRLWPARWQREQLWSRAVAAARTGLPQPRASFLIGNVGCSDKNTDSCWKSVFLLENKLGWMKAQGF